MRPGHRTFRFIAALNLMVLVIGLVSPAAADNGNGSEDAADAGVSPTTGSTAQSAPTSSTTTETTVPPPVFDVSVDALAEAARRTVADSAKFDMGIEAAHESWADKKVPVRTATVSGAYDGADLRFEMVAHDFAADHDEYQDLFEQPEPPVVHYGMRAAEETQGPLTVTVRGVDMYVCGVAPDGQCEVANDWQSVFDMRYLPAARTLQSTASFTAFPHGHVLSLAGAETVEDLGRAVVADVPVQHVRGTFTMDRAIRRAGPMQPQLEFWFGSLVQGSELVRIVREEGFPFEAWIDGAGRVRRVAVTVLLDVVEYVDAGRAPALSLLEAESTGRLTITATLREFSGSFDLAPPRDAEPIEAQTRSDPPPVPSTVDVDDAIEHLEEMLREQRGS